MEYRYTAEEKAILWLDSFDCLTYQQKSRILSFVADAANLFSQFENYRELLLKILPEKDVEGVSKTLKDGNYLNALLSNLDKKGIFFVTLRSENYPAALLQTPAPPVVLYCKGNENLLKGEHFSIVGARKTLSWAQALTKEFARKISKHFTLATGLAEGGDEAALRGALSAKEEKVNIVSVLAYGFDYVYPAAHADLLQEVQKRGLIITEHRPDIKPQKYLFPTRNRIIAGLSRGVLIVSGGKRSGTSITAGYALDYGRDIFAFPYNPGITSGAGCNALLKSGAYPVDCVEDIFLHYGLEVVEEKKLPPLTQEEKRLLICLKEKGELHIEEIAKYSSVPAYLVNGLLSGLEVKGYVVRAGGNRYAPVR